MVSEWIGTLTSGIFIAIIAYVNKRETNQSNSEIRMVKNMASDQHTRISAIELAQEKNDSSHVFRQNVYNSINEVSAIKIIESQLYSNDTLSESLIEYFDNLSDFAISFFYSSLRNNPRITKKFFSKVLAKKFTSIFSKLISNINECDFAEKCLLVGTTKTPITFLEYLKTRPEKEPNCFNLNDLLLNSLVEKDINETQLIGIFVTYTDNFLDEFKNKFDSFNKLKDFEVEIDSKF